MIAEFSLASRWQSIEEYYRGLSTCNAGDRAIRVVEGMRAFVERIAPAAIAENLSRARSRMVDSRNRVCPIQANCLPAVRRT
jgi:hypothetical protein